ncbi:MAG: NAD(P)H-dependent oxidoreductase subunit E [Oscillospiraceae bacterium]
MKRISKLPFTGTPEQERQLKSWLDENGKGSGAALPALQYAQGIYGYLPVEVLRMVAKGVDKSLEEIYGIATFYAQFSLSPKGQYKVAVCLGTACYVKGSGKILSKLEEKLGIQSGECREDGKFSLESSRCIGACGLAPVFTINDDVYGRVKEDGSELDAILSKYQD